MHFQNIFFVLLLTSSVNSHQTDSMSKTLHVAYLFVREQTLHERSPAVSLAIEDFQAGGGLVDYHIE